MNTELVKITCVYFKDSGKYYCDGECEIAKSLLDGCIYPREIGQRLNSLKLLPGLHSGTWDGPFLIEPEESYPELVTK